MLTNELVFFWVTNELVWVLILFWKKIQFYALKENNKKNKIEYPFYYKGSIDKNTAFSLLNTLTLSLPLILRPRLHLPLSRVFFFFFFLFGFFFPFYFHFHFSSSISIFFPFFFRWIELLIPLKTLTLEICDTKKKTPIPNLLWGRCNSSTGLNSTRWCNNHCTTTLLSWPPHPRFHFSLLLSIFVNYYYYLFIIIKAFNF